MPLYVSPLDHEHLEYAGNHNYVKLAKSQHDSLLFSTALMAENPALYRLLYRLTRQKLVDLDEKSADISGYGRI